MRSLYPILATSLTLSFATVAGCEGCENTDTGADETTRSVAAPETENPRVEGYEVISAKRRPGPRATEGPAPEEHLVREPTTPDPLNGTFTLEDAVVGLGTDGTLVAEINTDLGTIMCDLDAERTPNAVANFIGLATGRRTWWDPRAGSWRGRPLYNRSSFFRVIPDFGIQAGDVLDDGTGTVGYTIPDEPIEGMRHDRAGQLCMASFGVNENGGQFFITDGPAPQLDADTQYTIFGQCQQTEVIERIARVPQGDDNHPRTRVEVIRVLIRRVQGGAAVAQRSAPTAPEGPTEPRGASPGPSELQFGGHAPEAPGMPEREDSHEGHGH